MKKLLHMTIVDQRDSHYMLHIRERNSTTITEVTFDPIQKNLTIESTELGKFLRSNEYQFRKLLHNKRPHTYFIGFELDFSIIDQKDIALYNNKENIIITDHEKTYVKKKSSLSLLEIYSDGSYDEKSSTGAIGYIALQDNVVIHEHFTKVGSHSSSHLELLAVIEALRKFKENIRIYTDSQYVRKGITEWIHHWKVNNYTTANGSRAKNVDDWKALENLIQNRYIEWVWIKGHRSNIHHNYVDLKVGQTAKGKL